jgi:hypothetical protein
MATSERWGRNEKVKLKLGIGIPDTTGLEPLPGAQTGS